MRARVVVLACCTMFAGCGKSSVTESNVTSNNTLTHTTYTGTFANRRMSGTLTVSVVDTGAANGSSYATGSIVFLSGDTAFVTGSYLRKFSHLELSGGGDEITGNLVSGSLTGVFSEPTSSGRFAVQPDVSGSAPKLYCGTYVTTRDFGWLAMVSSPTGIASGFFAGLAVDTSKAFAGTLTSLTFAATTLDSIKLAGVPTPDGSTITGTYTPTFSPGAGTFQVSTGACSSAGASTNSGFWTTSDSIVTTKLHFALVEALGSLTGGGVVTVNNVPGWTGDEFLITSASITGTQLSLTARLGANPDGAGGFFYGSLSFNGTISAAPLITGTLVFTPPRTATQTFAQQTVAGVTLSRN